MRLLTGMMIFAMAASAGAQSASTVQNVKSQLSGSKPAPAAAAAAKPVSQPAAAMPSAKKPAVASAPKSTPVSNTTAAPKPSAAPKAAHAVKVEPKPKAAEKEASKGAAAEPKKKVRSADGRRDPFTSPVMERFETGGPSCSSGKRCLSADQIALRGIVRSNSGSNIAVVVTSDNRAYFLRENDPIHNGVVTKINENSVTFREQVKDVLGKPAMREVVKKINTPA